MQPAAGGGRPELDLPASAASASDSLRGQDVDPLVRAPPARGVAEVVGVDGGAEDREDDRAPACRLDRAAAVPASKGHEESEHESEGSSGCRPVASHELRLRLEGPDPSRAGSTLLIAVRRRNEDRGLRQRTSRSRRCRHRSARRKRLDRSGERHAEPVRRERRRGGAAAEGGRRRRQEVVLVSLGPERALDALRKALAMGADRVVLVSDEAAAGSDLVATSRALAAGARARGAPTSCSSASRRATPTARCSGPRSPTGCAAR